MGHGMEHAIIDRVLPHHRVFPHNAVTPGRMPMVPIKSEQRDMCVHTHTRG
jgi:hypothetical protein